MDKKALFIDIIQRLETEFTTISNASKFAHEAATHEESKAEDQYDTRGLEASYLAEAQANRANEIQLVIKTLKEFPLPSFSNSDRIQPGALVELLQDGQPFWAFFLPCGGGTGVQFAGKKISVVTTSSPFGAEINGKKVGDSFEILGRNSAKEYEVVSLR